MPRASKNAGASAASWAPVVHGDHALLKHKLSILRSADTSNATFRSTLRDLTFYLGYEATKDFATTPVEVQTPVGVTAQCERLAENVAIVPIMRAGLGMVEPMLELLPDAAVFHLGMFRSKSTTLMPVQYYNKLPNEHNFDVAIVLEPLIATSTTITAVLDILASWGVPKVIIMSVVASEPGVARITELQATYPNVALALHVAVVDPATNENDMVVPGLGDVGGRQFSTERDMHAAEDTQTSKRARR